MIAARTDVWGDAARQQPNGASYDVLQRPAAAAALGQHRLPPLPDRAQCATGRAKARLVSNGSAINPRANKPPMWYEQGTPVAFFVGDPAEPFGADLKRLEEPTYLDGFLPVVNIMYRANNESYNEEVFAPVDTKLAASGTSLVRFSLAGGESSAGSVEARVDPKGPLTATERRAAG